MNTYVCKACNQKMDASILPEVTDGERCFGRTEVFCAGCGNCVLIMSERIALKRGYRGYITLAQLLELDEKDTKSETSHCQEY